MNMISKVPADGEAQRLRVKIADRPRWQRAAIYGTPLVALAAAVTLWTSEPSPAAAPPTPQVTVAAPLEREVSLWDDYVGRFEASRSVEVRPRVSGQIVGIHFTDGEIVKQGQLLFTVDARPFNAALAEARAGVATAQSELSLAQLNLGRARRLLEADAVSQASVDQLTAQVQTARAALAAAQARVQQRALDVEFTRIRAPIGGRISDRKIDAGNLVSAGVDGGTLLTTINALDPIHFTFDVPESLYLKDARQRREGAAGDVAEIRLQDEASYNWRGTLDFTDNGISANSGTVRARAVVRNPDYFLTPGMFGNMRLADGGTTLALLVPDTAIRTDQARKIVLTVGKDDTVAAKPVETGPLVGNLRVIRSGLTRADRVIVQGVQFAMPGAKVKPRVMQVRAAEGAAGPLPAAERVHRGNAGKRGHASLRALQAARLPHARSGERLAEVSRAADPQRGQARARAVGPAVTRDRRVRRAGDEWIPDAAIQQGRGQHGRASRPQPPHVRRRCGHLHRQQSRRRDGRPQSRRQEQHRRRTGREPGGRPGRSGTSRAHRGRRRVFGGVRARTFHSH